MRFKLLKRTIILLHIFFSYHCQISTINPFLQEANQLTESGLYREAIDNYNKSLEIEPHSHVAHKNLGIVLVKVGNYKIALEHLKKSLTNIADDETYYFIAEAYRALNKFADAIFYYQKVIEIKPEDEKSLIALSWSYFQIRYYSQALEISRKLFTNNASDTQAAIIAARTFIKLKQLDKAVHILATAAKHAKKHQLPYIYSVQGDVEFELNNIQKASKLYKTALSHQPLLAGSLLGLGKCFLKNGNNKKAIIYIERARRIKPSLAETNLYLGQAYEQTDWKKAITYYQIFRKKISNDPEYLSLFSQLKNKIAQLRKDHPSSLDKR